MYWKPISVAIKNEEILVFDNGKYYIAKYYDPEQPCWPNCKKNQPDNRPSTGWWTGCPYSSNSRQIYPSHFCYLTPPKE